jgi:Ca-activated chloride channel family protein
MKIMPFIAILFFACTCFKSRAQQTERTIQKGNDFYKKQKYPEAEKEYNKISGNDSLNTIAKFNLANTLYRLGNKEEALRIFDQLAAGPKDNTLLSKQYYNKGVVLSSQQKPEESITAYENALLRDPDDKETRENLQKALLELKKTDKKKEQQQKQRSQSQLNPKEAEQKLKQLEQKEKELQQRMQKDKSNSGGSLPKDW